MPVGNMHLVGLDLGQGGTGPGPSGASLQPGNPWAEREAKQIAWLKADLAAVDRAVTLELGRIIALYCPLIHFIPDSRTDLVLLYLKRQCDRTLGDAVGDGRI